MAKSAKQRREEYYNGKPGVTYGIWNGMTKRFVYGIREATPHLARKKLIQMAGKGSYCHRYDAKPIPEGWVNPVNELYAKKAQGAS